VAVMVLVWVNDWGKEAAESMLLPRLYLATTAWSRTVMLQRLRKQPLWNTERL
jgi:hypothetical protein